jgi:hypothetical protein
MYLLAQALINLRFDPEEGSDMFLRNVDKHLQDHAASQPRRPKSTYLNLSITYTQSVSYCKLTDKCGKARVCGLLRQHY